MAYFRNNAVNLLNIHYAIHSIAMTGAGAFFAAYLFKAGVSVPGVFLTFAAILTGRFLIRPMIIPLAARFGMRVLIITGTLLSACQYPLLARVHGVGPALYAIIAIGAVADTFYWPSYHAYFARVGDDEHRGHQVSAREAIVALVGVVSPLLTGFLLVTFGPKVAFGITAGIVAAAAVPLLWTPEFRVAKSAAGAIRAALPGVLLFVGDGFTGGVYVFVWQIALFRSLSENFMAYGGALAIAAVVGAVGGLYLGRYIDSGGRRAVYIACGSLGLVLLMRAAATHNPALAVFANAMSALGGCLYIPTIMTVVYTLGKGAPCTLRFHVATEAGWDLGGATGLVAAAFLSWSGVPLWAILLLGVLGVTWQFVLLRGHYARRLAASAGLAE
ncbi:MAG TPA: MFS transporter [Rhizomicrobium sp.]|nr:MFS transporter [Rhizomicrobium sp.]